MVLNIIICFIFIAIISINIHFKLLNHMFDENYQEIMVKYHKFVKESI